MITVAVCGLGLDISPPGIQIYLGDYWIDIEVFRRGGFSITPHYKFEPIWRSLIIADDNFGIPRN
jgi:hypothetical protein